MKSIKSQKLRSLLLRGLLVLAPVAANVSCSNDVSSIGSSLVTDKSEVTVDSAFTVTGKSIATTELRARSLSQLIGSIDVRNYGSLTSDYVTQLMPAAKIDTVTIDPENVDSLKLVLRFYGNTITGDSMTPMGIKVFALNRQLPSILSSSFEPDGYYDSSKPLSSTIYSSNLLYSDSLENNAIHAIVTDMPISMGRNLIAEYNTNPATFTTPDGFADFFPGIYVSNSFGTGRVTNIFNTCLQLYYHYSQKYTNKAGEERDTTIHTGSIIAMATPEVLTNNNMQFDIAPELTKLASEATIAVSPLGYEPQITLPVRDILASYRKASSEAMVVVNSLTMRLPVDTIANAYGINPPPHILLIPTSQRNAFFDQQKVPDNVTSFIADYSSTTKSYYFSNLRPYIMDIIGSNKTEAELEEFSTLSIVPVEVTSETTEATYYNPAVTIVTAVGPHIEGPAMCKFDLSNAKIRFTYSSEKINF